MKKILLGVSTLTLLTNMTLATEELSGFELGEQAHEALLRGEIQRSARLYHLAVEQGDPDSTQYFKRQNVNATDLDTIEEFLKSIYNKPQNSKRPAGR